MSHYFVGFPTVAYNPPVPRLTGSGNALRSKENHIATDISKRLLIKQLTGDPNLVYYEYIVEDGERPDIIAEKYYGDSRVDWVILMYNQIVDPYFQWVLSIRNFEQYLRQKYGSIAVAQATVNRYEKLIHGTSTYTNDFGETINIPARYVTVDKSTYDTLAPTSRREVDAYTHEDNLNEKRRNIRLLEEDFIGDLMDNYRELFF
jgi:hypothetical protein